MSALKKFFAPALLGTAMALSAASAFALNVGDSGSFDEMKAKLAQENQTEIVNAAAGKAPNLRGVKFYYNQVSKVAYIALTNDPVRPNQMRIISQTSQTEPYAAITYANPAIAVLKCEELVKEQKATKEDCASFKSTIESVASVGQEVFQQGRLPSSNVQTSVMSTKSGSGHIFETTREGATVTKLVFGNAQYTEDGIRMFAAIAPKKTALADQVPTAKPN